MFQYKPKKSREIYDETIAHRGFHFKFPENTMPAFIEAVNKNLAIELDIRITKDDEIICLHDRYTKRLLGEKGKASDLLYSDIEKLNVLYTKEKVPTLKEVLEIVDGKTTLLIEVKGYFNKRFEVKLVKLLSTYEGKVYFHAKNIFTFFKLRSIWNDKVFWVLNPLRKRFNFIKTKLYKNMIKEK